MGGRRKLADLPDDSSDFALCTNCLASASYNLNLSISATNFSFRFSLLLSACLSLIHLKSLAICLSCCM